MTVTRYDAAVVGAGVVGTAIARQLSLAGASVVILEAGADVGAGTSKANTAILHTGFDAKPGTLESRLVARGYELLRDYGAAAGIAVERIGAYMVAWDDDQRARFDDLLAQAAANGYDDGRVVDARAVRERLPHLGAGALDAIHIPGESIVDPWSPTIAFATDALRAGARLQRGAPVIGVDRTGDEWRLSTPHGVICADWVVNAAGLHSDEVDRLFGYHEFTVTPRRGELIVFDKAARSLLDHIVLPIPAATTKGVLLAPTVFGNVLLGPTADDIDDKAATGSTRDGIERLLAAGRRMMPAIVDCDVTAVYAGLRAATEHTDYCIAVRPTERLVTVGGIRSTGLTASLAIAEHVASEMGLERDLATSTTSTTAATSMPPLGELQTRPHRDAHRIASDPAYGAIVCHCERVSVGEIRDACASAIPPVDVDGLRRRTRASTGRCQGFHCAANLAGFAPGPIEVRSDVATTPLQWDVVVVGAGPAGLALAESLARRGAAIAVLDREAEAGGIPQWSPHRSFGLLDLHRLLTGPEYARRRIDRAVAAGAAILTRHSVTGWDGDDLAVTRPEGLASFRAPVIVIATGSRERPRSARLVPGDRPAGVLTTGSLQRLLAGGLPVGRRAVIVGAEHVSYSAALSLRHAGVEVAAMVTERPRHDTFAAFAVAMRALGVRLRTDTRVAAVRGRARVERIEFGDGSAIECDTVVFTGDWVAEDELLRRAPDRAGLVSAGSVRRPGRRADQCAIEARRLEPLVLALLEPASSGAP